MPDRAGMVSDLCLRTGSGLYAAVTGQCGKSADLRHAADPDACKIHPAGGILRSLHRYPAGFCQCHTDGLFSDHQPGILSADGNHTDDSYHCHCAGSGALDGIWHGTKNCIGCHHHIFPIAVGLLDGYKSVDQDAVNLMRAMGATKFQIFRHLKFPSALNQFFSGLKISASYAVVGAVVAEWLGGFNGLGVYMTRVKKAYAFDKMFAVVIFIVIISLLLMLAVNIIRNLSMPWIRTEKEGKEV